MQSRDDNDGSPMLASLILYSAMPVDAVFALTGRNAVNRPGILSGASDRDERDETPLEILAIMQEVIDDEY